MSIKNYWNQSLRALHELIGLQADYDLEEAREHLGDRSL